MADYLDQVIAGNARTIIEICAQDRDDKQEAVEGLIHHAIVRARQIDRGEIENNVA